MGFTVIPDALRAAGRTGHDALAEIRGADCGTPVEGVCTALPGTRAASAAVAYVTSWKTAFTSWCADADREAVSLGEAAATYTAGDDNAGSSVPGAGNLTGPR